jgi:hypothetical protein
MRARLRSLVVLSLVSALVACGKKDDSKSDSTAEGAPALPASGTLSVDFKAKGEAGDAFALVAQAGRSRLGATSTNNHAAAAVVFALTNVYVGAYLVTPVLMLARGAQETAKAQVDGSWLWSYDVTVGGVKDTVNLTGVRTGEASATWSLKLTTEPRDANGCCDAFELLTGSTSDGEKGAWIVNDPSQPKTPTPLFTTTYDYESPTDKTLAFTLETTRAATERFGKGSYASYAVKDDAVTLQVRDASEAAPRTILFDRGTGAGSQVDPAGTKSCWGPAPSYADIAC